MSGAWGSGPGAGGAGGTHGSTLMAQADAKANRNGPHHTVYWVRGNPAFEKSKTLGLASDESKYRDGARYQGDWADNKKDGFGTLTSPDGTRYEGEFRANKRHGKGTLLIRRGGKYRKKYTGDWANNKRDGMGVYFYDDGAKYEGEWVAGKRHGRGKMAYVSGEVYQGDWVDDKRSGLGVLTLTDGNHYEGHWHNDKKEGPGRFFYLTTRKMYEGEWADDVAKCGVFSDLPFDVADDEAGAAEDAFVLPPCALEDADAVVVDAVDSVRKWRLDQLRAAGLVEAAPTSAADLSEEEVEQLRAAFGVVDSRDTGIVMGRDLTDVLGALGIAATPDDLAALLEELGADVDSPITFDDFANIMALLRE
mmetsp:Transcript_15016/g.35543  ORF Transcript_15016/g.35543 Transcript_15016/m.35543 type:complete len:364 (-) Transcript_15016:31-1122(-)